MFDGFKSRCKTDAEWMYFTPHKIWYRKYFTCWSLSLCMIKKKKFFFSGHRAQTENTTHKSKGGNECGGKIRRNIQYIELRATELSHIVV